MGDRVGEGGGEGGRRRGGEHAHWGMVFAPGVSIWEPLSMARVGGGGWERGAGGRARSMQHALVHSTQYAVAKSIALEEYASVLAE